MSMDLDVTTHMHHGDAVVSVDGEIDLTSCDQLRERIEAVDLRDARDMVIDLTRVAFIDSTGLSVLVATARRVQDDGHGFGVVADGHLRELLRITGLDTVMTVHARLTDLDGDPGGADPLPRV